MLRIFLFSLAIVLVFTYCKKDPFVPVIAPKTFELFINNEYNAIESQYAVWLSDQDGLQKAFRWIPGNDTAIVSIPGSLATDRFDCTIAEIVKVDESGSGVTDTIIRLTTYTQIGSGQSINLRIPNKVKVCDLKVKFEGMTSFDSIVVSDAFILSKPQSINNYTAHYRVQHTGDFWFRVLVNGDPHWRFLVVDNITSDLVDLGTINPSVMGLNLAYHDRMNFPFSSIWKYTFEGAVDTALGKYFPLGEPLRAPGGATYFQNFIDVVEPITDDVFFPTLPKPYTDFRLKAYGSAINSGGYDYAIDQYFDSIPLHLPIPTWDIEPTTATGYRIVAVKCVGDFDVLSFSRSRSTNPSINWEVQTKPQNGAIISYRLPDVPEEIGKRYPALGNYYFDNSVRARAENYSLYSNYEYIQRKKMKNDDAYWQAKGKYLARERAF
jgi:hypothetical protein